MPDTRFRLVTRSVQIRGRPSAANKHLQRTVIRRGEPGATASFHSALAPRPTVQRAAAKLRR